MDDWGGGIGSGGDLNGNGRFDPGDMEIWYDINHNSSGGSGDGNNGGGCSGYMWYILIPVIFGILGGLFG